MKFILGMVLLSSISASMADVKSSEAHQIFRNNLQLVDTPVERGSSDTSDEDVLRFRGKNCTALVISEKDFTDGSITKFELYLEVMSEGKILRYITVSSPLQSEMTAQGLSLGAKDTIVAKSIRDYQKRGFMSREDMLKAEAGKVSFKDLTGFDFSERISQSYEAEFKKGILTKLMIQVNDRKLFCGQMKVETYDN